MSDSNTEQMYVAVNKSSRAFTYGKLTLLPHVPCQVTATDKDTIEGSPFGDNFEFRELVPPARSNEGNS